MVAMASKLRNRETLVVAALGLGVFAITFLGSARGFIRTPFPAHDRDTYRPKYKDVSGNQLVMIYFGSANCAWSNHTDSPTKLERIKLALERQATLRGWSFEAIGVALDWNPLEGIRHLSEFGAFDEVSAGNNSANAVALRYFGSLILEPESTPEIIVIGRTVSKPDFVHSFTYRTNNERIIMRKVGLVEIDRWLSIGAPIPALKLEGSSAKMQKHS